MKVPFFISCLTITNALLQPEQQFQTVKACHQEVNFPSMFQLLSSALFVGLDLCSA